jgi:4-amino-4-deoxy-L-arabinose transferase-like glycosyltransferase
VEGVADSPGKKSERVTVVRRVLGTAGLACILAYSLHLNLWNNDFHWSLHPDERRKVRAARLVAPEFFHPLVLHHSTRVAVALTGAQTRQERVEAGRLISGLLGTGTVLLSFLLFRRRMGWVPALSSTALVATAPIVVIHAHYLKEDTYLTFFTTLSILALLAFQRERPLRTVLCLGLATGLAISSKYAGALLFLVYLLLPLVVPVGDRRAYYPAVGLVALIALAVFLVLNAALFTQFGDFLHGVRSETTHAFRGHMIRVWGPSYLFAFHLVHSLGPGLSFGVTFAALAGVVYVARRSVAGGRGDQRVHEDRVLLLCLAVLYLAVELVPMKTFPAYMRYALPLAPLLVYFLGRGVQALAERLATRPEWVSIPLFVLLLAYPAYDARMLVRNLVDDSRAVTAERVLDLQGAVLMGDYSVLWRRRPPPRFDKAPLYERDEKRIARADYIVASSFRYQRYLFGERLLFQREEARRRAQLYRRLFACPYEEIRPRYKTFAFSNPTIRIVKVRGCDFP